MPLLAWMLLFGFGMSAIALVGALAVLLPRGTLERMLLPLVAFAAGSLVGGALFQRASRGSRTASICGSAPRSASPRSSAWSSSCTGITGITATAPRTSTRDPSVGWS